MAYLGIHLIVIDMKHTANTSPSASGRLFIYLIAIIVLALLAIISTSLPTEIQQRVSLLGLPVILWFWLGVAVLSSLLTTLVAWQIIRGNNDG